LNILTVLHLVFPGIADQFGLANQSFKASQESKTPWVNGRPPADAVYRALVHNQFADWVLEVCGLVEEPLRLTLEDLRGMQRQTQVTRHNRIQGWSYVASSGSRW
jgi:methionine sulfoxide reductase catalytic subunit